MLGVLVFSFLVSPDAYCSPFFIFVPIIASGILFTDWSGFFFMPEAGQDWALRRPSSPTELVDVFPPSPPLPILDNPTSLVVFEDPPESPDTSPELTPSRSPGSLPSYASESSSEPPTPSFVIDAEDPKSNEALDDTVEVVFDDDDIFFVAATPTRRHLRLQVEGTGSPPRGLPRGAVIPASLPPPPVTFRRVFHTRRAPRHTQQSPTALSISTSGLHDSGTM